MQASLNALDLPVHHSIKPIAYFVTNMHNFTYFKKFFNSTISLFKGFMHNLATFVTKLPKFTYFVDMFLKFGWKIVERDLCINQHTEVCSTVNRL